MASIPTQKKILIENFGKEKDWIGALLEPLNKFMDEVTRALNRQLTFKENLSADIKTVVIDGNYPQRFKWTLPSKPVAAWIGQARELSENHTTITEALYLDWEMTADGMVQINNIADLNASTSNKFNVTIVLITG